MNTVGLPASCARKRTCFSFWMVGAISGNRYAFSTTSPADPRRNTAARSQRHTHARTRNVQRSEVASERGREREAVQMRAFRSVWCTLIFRSPVPRFFHCCRRLVSALQHIRESSMKRQIEGGREEGREGGMRKRWGTLSSKEKSFARVWNAVISSSLPGDGPFGASSFSYLTVTALRFAASM